MRSRGLAGYLPAVPCPYTWKGGCQDHPRSLVGETTCSVVYRLATARLGSTATVVALGLCPWALRLGSNADRLSPWSLQTLASWTLTSPDSAAGVAAVDVPPVADWLPVLALWSLVTLLLFAGGSTAIALLAAVLRASL